MPSSGLSPCESAAGPPPAPLASPYRLTAVANAWPASSPTHSVKTSIARDAPSSRHSLAASHRIRADAPASGERKKHVLEIGAGTQPRAAPQLHQCPLGDGGPVVQQHEPIAHTGRVGH